MLEFTFKKDNKEGGGLKIKKPGPTSFMDVF